jgi:hypothetical protein
MLDRVPPEVLELIIGEVGAGRPRNVNATNMPQIRTPSDLKSLCEVSKYIANAATPYLYESITLHAEEMLGLDDLTRKVERCYNNNIKFTRNICLEAPLTYNLRKRCPHYNSDIPEIVADAIDMDNGSEVRLQVVLLFLATEAENLNLGGH